MLSHCGEDGVISKANDICQKVNAIKASHADVVAASFGISSTEQASFNYKALFDLADQAVYQPKAKGGNTVCSIGDRDESIAS